MWTICSVHALQELPFPSEAYNVALQAVTDRYTGRGALPGAPNGSALIDIRTNEIALSLDGQWQLREFHIGAETGLMTPSPLFQTPDRSFDTQPALARFINANEDVLEVNIEGHADSTGGADYNMALSKLRAESVKRLLVLFGAAFVDHYSATREWEEREFRKAITEWELDRYMEII